MAATVKAAAIAQRALQNLPLSRTQFRGTVRLEHACRRGRRWKKRRSTAATAPQTCSCDRNRAARKNSGDTRAKIERHARRNPFRWQPRHGNRPVPRARHGVVAAEEPRPPHRAMVDPIEAASAADARVVICIAADAHVGEGHSTRQRQLGCRSYPRTSQSRDHVR